MSGPQRFLLKCSEVSLQLPERLVHLHREILEHVEEVQIFLSVELWSLGRVPEHPKEFVNLLRVYNSSRHELIAEENFMHIFVVPFNCPEHIADFLRVDVHVEEQLGIFNQNHCQLLNSLAANNRPPWLHRIVDGLHWRRRQQRGQIAFMAPHQVYLFVNPIDFAL